MTQAFDNFHFQFMKYSSFIVQFTARFLSTKSKLIVCWDDKYLSRYPWHIIGSVGSFRFWNSESDLLQSEFSNIFSEGVSVNLLHAHFPSKNVIIATENLKKILIGI